MLGDMGQLESIGSLNLAADMINSKEIPTVELKEYIDKQRLLVF